MKFVKLKSSAALNTYIQRHSQPLLRRIGKSDGRYKLSMTIQPFSRRADHQIKLYIVKGEIAIRGRTELRAEKKNASAEQAVLMVVKALEKELQRWTEKTERSRKTFGQTLKPVHEHKWDFTKHA